MTREHLDTRIDGVETRMMRVVLMAVGVLITAMALMMTVAGFLPVRGGG